MLIAHRITESNSQGFSVYDCETGIRYQLKVWADPNGANFVDFLVYSVHGSQGSSFRLYNREAFEAWDQLRGLNTTKKCGLNIGRVAGVFTDGWNAAHGRLEAAGLMKPYEEGGE